MAITIASSNPSPVFTGPPYAGGTNVASGGTGPYTYAVHSGAIPNGLSLNTGTGAITGTPTVPGPFSFVIRATDSTAATGDSPTLTIQVNQLTLVSNFPATGFVGDTINAAVESETGTGPFTFAVTSGSLPDTVSLDGATGIFSGTLTDDTGATFTVTATDSVGDTGTLDFAITVSDALEAPALPQPFRIPQGWTEDDCLYKKAGHQMVRLFFDAVQTPNFNTTLIGNLQQPVGLFKSLLYNVLWQGLDIVSGDLQGVVLVIESSQTLQRIALSPPNSIGSVAGAGNALADCWLTGCCPFYANDETSISVQYANGGKATSVQVRLHFCNWEIPPFYIDGTDNWSD